MTRIEIDGQTLTVHVEGLDKLWALKSRLSVPLAHVSGAAPAEDEARGRWHGVRAPGTYVPGILTAGTFHVKAGRVFWDAHAPERAIAIMLHDDRYAKLVIEVAHPANEIRRIEAAVVAFAKAR